MVPRPADHHRGGERQGVGRGGDQCGDSPLPGYPHPHLHNDRHWQIYRDTKNTPNLTTILFTAPAAISATSSATSQKSSSSSTLLPSVKPSSSLATQSTPSLQTARAGPDTPTPRPSQTSPSTSLTMSPETGDVERILVSTSTSRSIRISTVSQAVHVQPTVREEQKLQKQVGSDKNIEILKLLAELLSVSNQ